MAARSPQSDTPRPGLRQRPRRKATEHTGDEHRVPPRKRIYLTLGPVEKAEVSEAAQARGQTPAAFAVEAVLTAARNAGALPDALRLELRLLMNLAGLIRRSGLALRQAAAAPDRGASQRKALQDAAEECMRTVRKVDDAAEAIRRRIP